MKKIAFLNLAVFSEGVIFFLALILAWFFAINPLQSFFWNLAEVGVGVLGIVPLLLLLWAVMKINWTTFSKIRNLLIETLGEQLAISRWYELALVAIMAGIAEEVLFRGVIQTQLEFSFGWLPALLLTGLLFGALHFVSIGYAVAATIAGIYLGLLFDITGSRNLLIPIVAHSLYDFIAFLVLANQCRKRSLVPQTPSS